MRALSCFVAAVLVCAASPLGATRAEDKSSARPALSEAQKKHWAFQPLTRPHVPAPPIAGWAANPIDSFISARLAREGLKPTREADRTTLIRRLKFDLLGLPPTPEEVDAFVRDRSPDAYEQLVERYLASPHFGERWARHWLDVVRFAETTGFETNALRPNAWPYRDYIIRALNGDKPYDQFIRDQLAGDAGGQSEATGYLVAGTFDQVKGDPLLTLQQRADELHDIVSNTASTFLGLTVGCARCHDHKFDPVSQVDYYGLKAIFEGVQHGERPVPMGDPSKHEAEAAALDRELAEIEVRLARMEALAVPDSESKGSGSARTLRMPANHRRNVERFAPVEARFIRMTILETAANVEPCIDELEVFTAGDKPRNIALANEGTRASASSTLPGFDIHKLEHINDGRYGNGRSWISNERGKGWIQLEFAQTVKIDTIVWSRDRSEGAFSDRVATKYRVEVAVEPGKWTTIADSTDRSPCKGTEIPTPPGLSADELKLYQKLLDQERALASRRSLPAGSQLIYAGKFTPPEPTYRLHRGEVAQKREQVAPAAPAEFGARLQLPLDAPEQERRIALGKWIIDPKNPLCARVMVNRIWQHHFGAGIVSTPSDFGLNGARPTHPELLDWLADEFVAGGWQMKRLHRLIVLSSSYRQAGTSNPEGLAKDADCRLLWRYPSRRLDAEPLRDAILIVSGRLDQHMGGAGFELFEPKGNSVQGVRIYVPKKEFGPAEWRRMIYQTKPRMRLDDTFGAFDCPYAGPTDPNRTTSRTPLQVFNLINSPFMLQQAGFFAQRLRQEVPDDSAAQVRRGYSLAYQRDADDDEMALGIALAREQGLRAFCLALFNTSEFLYVH